MPKYKVLAGRYLPGKSPYSIRIQENRDRKNSAFGHVSSSECYNTTCTDGIYLLKVNNGNTRTRCEICSELTIKNQENATGVYR